MFSVNVISVKALYNTTSVSVETNSDTTHTHTLILYLKTRNRRAWIKCKWQLRRKRKLQHIHKTLRLPVREVWERQSTTVGWRTQRTSTRITPHRTAAFPHPESPAGRAFKSFIGFTRNSTSGRGVVWGSCFICTDDSTDCAVLSWDSTTATTSPAARPWWWLMTIWSMQIIYYLWKITSCNTAGRRQFVWFVHNNRTPLHIIAVIHIKHTKLGAKTLFVILCYNKIPRGLVDLDFSIVWVIIY